MRKKFKLTLFAFLMMFVVMACFACGGEDGFTVTLDLQNGTEPTTQVVEPNGTVVFPTVEDEAYRTFRGWFKDSEGKSVWLKSTGVTEDITLYGCWTALYCKVSFSLNYEGAPKVNDVSIPLGNTLELPEIPTRECWVLTGWYLDAAHTTPFDLTTILTNSNLKLYAKWELEAGHEHAYTKVTTAMTCTEDGFDTNTCACGHSYVDNIVTASGHKFTFSDTDYFGMVACENEGCTGAGRKESLRIYEDDFVYNLDEIKQTEINNRYTEMLTILDSIASYDETLHGYVFESERYVANKQFEDVYNAFYDDLIYVTEQYQYAYVFYCVDDNEDNTAKYEFVTDFRTELISDFYALYRLIYETEYREYFFAEDEGWTEEDIQMALTMSDSYGGEEYVAINDRISEIEVAFREISDPSRTDDMLPLYEEFVVLNNQIAELAGYENYIEYAYENVYNRDYSPEDTKVMRNYVKNNLKQVFTNIYLGYSQTQKISLEKGTAAAEIYNAINASIFDSKQATDLVKGYLEAMNSTTAGAKEIDFYKYANELFKNGNYYTGNYDGAFSYWISAQNTSILYFGPASYRSPFTFIHEFGHYYNNVYNEGISLSYDLDEVHSQANEMMFLAYLEDTLSNEVLRQMYSKLYYDNLFNMFAIVMLATAIDEFEYCVYTGTSPSGVPTQYTASNYDSLFKEIMGTYGIAGKLNDSYWRYVVIEAPCYYISYAMSALPCVELLSIADTQGFEAAQEIYFKFFTFTDVADHVELDDVGDKVVKIGYADTLTYAGVHSVFDENMYTKIYEYFVTNKKDFSYPDA